MNQQPNENCFYGRRLCYVVINRTTDDFINSVHVSLNCKKISQMDPYNIFNRKEELKNMSTVIIEGKEVFYFKRNELSEADLGELNDIYEETYTIAEFISNQLKVKCPDIGLSEIIQAKDDFGRISVEGAMLFTPRDIPSLKNNLIMMSLENFNMMQHKGTLAHEMRHIWQYTYHPEMNEKYAKGFGESLNHSAEIDADGYAIWYLSEFQNMYFEKAAGIICPKEKKYFPKAYMYRIEKAKEIKAYFDKQKN